MKYVKQCPYCNSVHSHLVFNAAVTRMVSKCEDCGYSGTSLFPDVEVSQIRAVEIEENIEKKEL